jgi:hypothetical protein
VLAALHALKVLSFRERVRERAFVSPHPGPLPGGERENKICC